MNDKQFKYLVILSLRFLIESYCEVNNLQKPTRLMNQLENALTDYYVPHISGLRCSEKESK